MNGARVVVVAAILAIAAIAWWSLGTGGDVAPAGGDVAAEGAQGPGAVAGGVDDATTPRDDAARVAAERERLAPARPPAGLRGRVVRGEAPVMGVTVRATPRSGPRDRRAAASTDGDGRFVLPLEHGSYDLAFWGAGVPNGWRYERLPARGHRMVDLGELQVPRAVRVRGRVVDESGQPVGDVLVRARSGGEGFRAAGGGGGGDGDEPAHPSVATDAQGRYTIDGLVPGKLHVRAEHVDYRSYGFDDESGERDEVVFPDIVLRAAPPLRGFVVDPVGKPAAGVTVIPGGGRHENPARERAVVTGDDGGFVLRGFGRRRSLTIVKDGFKHTVAEVSAEQQPVQVRLETATPLRGRVLGAAGRGGTFHIDWPPGGYRRGLWVELRHLYTQHALAADGTFFLDDLPEGKWLIDARVPGLGSVAPTAFEIPLAEPLELEPVPDVAVAVEVVDERDRPIVGARVWRVWTDDPGRYAAEAPEALARRWSGWAMQEVATTDVQGRVALAVPHHHPLMVAADAPLCGGSAALHVVGEVPARVRLVLPARGVVAGSLDDASATAHVNLSVALQRADGVEAKGVGSAIVDAEGRFRTGDMLPGPYRVLLLAADASKPDGFHVPVRDPVPLLGTYDPIAEVGTVDVVAGEVVEVSLSAPQLGEVTGRVLAAGAPVAGALVYGVAADDEGRYGGPDDLDAHRYHPSCRTGPDGRFRFLVTMAEPFELRARRATAPAWSPPTTLQLARGEAVARDLSLPAAAVRGRYDLAQVAVADRRFFTAQLYPADKAVGDPFVMGHYSASTSFEVQRQPLAADGTFAFEGLLPGTWVLRLVTRRDRIVVQRALTVVGDEVLDLGLLEEPARVAPRLACGLKARHGVWIRRHEAGLPNGAFVATVTNVRAATPWTWPELVPGRYRLHAFDVSDNRFGLGTSGHPTEQFVDVTVRPDGSCTPAEVWPDGL